MNKLSAVSFSVLFMMVLTLGMIPNAFARTVWTKQPPFPDAYANAWRGEHYPERETWWARASADKSTGVMEANIHTYMDVAGDLNAYFETAMIDLVTISSSGTLFITGVVFLKGHAHIYGIAFLFGAYEVAYSLDLWLTVDDKTTGTNLLYWKVNTWEDHEIGASTWITDRGYDFDWDYAIPQTSVPVQIGHTYKVTVKLTGWVGVAAAGIAAAQSDIDFESGDFQMKLKWLTYDAPSGGGGGGGGECPYVSVWDGNNYVLDNSILPTSQLGNGADVEDYYRLESALVPRNGKYSLLISEFEKEHSYIDQVKLLAVDHESDVNIAVAPDGEFLTYKNPVAPLSAVDVNGTDRLNQIRYMDGNLSDPATFFQGTEDDYLLLNFGQVNSENAKLIVRNDMYCMIKCINVQVMDSNGEWQTVAVIASRTYWAVEGVDLSPYVVEGRDLLVRLGWTMPHKLDYVGLDTTKQDDYELCEANLVSATHSTQGDVKALLLEGDDTHAELVPGQQIQLEFTLPNNSKQARTYIFYTKGHWYTI